MKKAYLKSLQKIKKVKNEKEYIALIEKENLLLIPTLEFMSGKKFEDLLKEGKQPSNFNAIFNATAKKSYKKRSKNIKNSIFVTNSKGLKIARYEKI